MGWKAVELQGALPRIQDAGKIQDQMQQRGQLMNNHITQQQLIMEERKRKKVIENQQNERVHLQEKSNVDSNENPKEIRRVYIFRKHKPPLSST
ncbi:hypothetical protein GLW08_01375 [Pontibacillus yanchengensis]|uniref:Uncharacterized protein n=2 Tax=Pontibacillus yanchengensis TaxID=462910 RepID=A0ACC7VBG5_9BACI|nr:hypothetical protein [Pontibacillus yanchengensis]MYL33170.1 hypothetical protein [Pontibacillus yanchengensis]MYL51980.1 hypothetical protein [Pontibacillus yanchengensis]